MQQLEWTLAKFDSNPGSERQAIHILLHIENLNLIFLDVCINEEHIQRQGIWKKNLESKTGERKRGLIVCVCGGGIIEQMWYEAGVLEQESLSKEGDGDMEGRKRKIVGVNQN